MAQDLPLEGPLDLAVRRLEQALTTLEAKLAARAAAEQDQDNDLFSQDRSRLAAELDAARARERDLERVAEEASAALGRAASEVRAALNADLTGA